MYRWDGILAGSVGFASFQLVPELPRCLFLLRVGLAVILTSPASLRYFVFFHLSCKHGEPHQQLTIDLKHPSAVIRRALSCNPEESRKLGRQRNTWRRSGGGWIQRIENIWKEIKKIQLENVLNAQYSPRSFNLCLQLQSAVQLLPAVIFRAAWGARTGAGALRPVVKVFPLNVGKIETLIVSESRNVSNSVAVQRCSYCAMI